MGIVSTQHSHWCHSTVQGGFNVVHHVADIGRLLRHQPVFAQDLVNHLALVDHSGIGLFEVRIEAEIPGLLASSVVATWKRVATKIHRSMAKILVGSLPATQCWW